MASRVATPEFGAVRTLASVFGPRSGLARALGRTFGGLRSVLEECGYKAELGPDDYRQRYDRGDIAGRIIDAYPDATWRGAAELVEDEDPQIQTAFEQAWTALNERLHIWPVLRRADILAALGRYSIVLIGAPGENYETELPRNLPAEAIAYLTPYSEREATIQTWERDVRNARFGLPLTYRVSRFDLGETTDRPRDVHWTRVLHVACDVLDHAVYGTPRLQRVWNRLDDLDKVVGGGSEGRWRAAVPGLQFDLDKDMALTDESREHMHEEIDKLVHQLTRVIRTRGVTVHELGASATEFGTDIGALISLISAATGIPQRILIGSERGEMASTQDRHNWAERVNERRSAFAEPFVVRPFVTRLVEHGALPAPAQPYTVRWGPVLDLSDMERAEYAGALAKVNQTAGDLVVTPDEMRDRALGWGPREDVELEREAEPPGEPGARVASRKKAPSWRQRSTRPRSALRVVSRAR